MLVTIDSATSTIRLVHLSVNEYLQDHAKILFPSAHGELAITCLTYFSLNDFHCVKLSTSEDRQKLSSKFHFLDYAVSNGGVHAAICFNAEVDRTTCEFLDNRPLLELWSQLYGVDRATVVQNLSALHVSAIFGIEKLAQDAMKDKSSPNPLDSYPYYFSGSLANPDVNRVRSFRPSPLSSLLSPLSFFDHKRHGQRHYANKL